MRRATISRSECFPTDRATGDQAFFFRTTSVTGAGGRDETLLSLHVAYRYRSRQ